ncbi:MAG: hypothetical protein M3040_11400 [Bacteroidota bacterium]|nr:hypothetical protein [Bacteroidota bacterium]
MTTEEKIQLPDFLIAELYKASLVDLETFSAKPVISPLQEEDANLLGSSISGEKIKYLGKNGKGIIAIVHQREAVFLKEEDLTFLTNILKACQLSLADIAIINSAGQAIGYEEIKEQFTTSTILLFDVEPSAIKLPFLIPPFQVQKFDDRTFLVAPPLGAINKPTREGKLLKTKLWVSLQKVFNIA